MSLSTHRNSAVHIDGGTDGEEPNRSAATTEHQRSSWFVATGRNVHRARALGQKGWAFCATVQFQSLEQLENHWPLLLGNVRNNDEFSYFVGQLECSVLQHQHHLRVNQDESILPRVEPREGWTREIPKLHAQIYFQTSGATTIVKARRLLLPCAHYYLNKAIASADKNKAYVLKVWDQTSGDDYAGERWYGDLPCLKFYEVGRPRKGKELHQATAAIIKGATVNQVAIDYPLSYVRNNRGLNALHNQLAEPRRYSDPALRIYLFGVTGTGKTYQVLHLLNDVHREFLRTLGHDPDSRATRDNIYFATDPVKGMWWFDGHAPYNHTTRQGHHTTMVEEWTGARVKIPIVNRLLDRGPYDPPIKNSFVKFNSPCIIFASNEAPWVTVETGYWRKFPLEVRRAYLRRWTEQYSYVFECKKEEHFCNEDCDIECEDEWDYKRIQVPRRDIAIKMRDLRERDFSSNND